MTVTCGGCGTRYDKIEAPPPGGALLCARCGAVLRFAVRNLEAAHMRQRGGPIADRKTRERRRAGKHKDRWRKEIDL